MSVTSMRRGAALAALGVIAVASSAEAATESVAGWAVHNGTSTVAGTSEAPTFTPADNMTLMSPFSAISLVNDGDFVEATTTLTLTDRTANTGTNALNTQLRFGLFNGPNGVVTASDIPNLGFIIEYTNVLAGGLIREQTSDVQTNPFVSPTDRGNGVQDSGADSIFGANPGPVTFTLRLTRDAGQIDLTGSISGTEFGTGDAYLATYTLLNITPSDTSFTFDRIGLFLGGNADASSATLSSASVTSVPEPASLAVPALAAAAILAKRRSRISLEK